MSIVLVGSTSGSITLQEPAVAGSTTISLPATTGTVVLQNGSNNLLMNSGYGSDAVAYGCRAWVNFNGTSTVAIRGSGNVSSITDRGTGQYTINFTTAMPDTNYAGVASATIGGSDNSNRDAAVGSVNTSSAYCNSWVADTGSFIDVDVICAAIFR